MAPNTVKEIPLQEQELPPTPSTQAKSQGYTIVYPAVLVLLYWHIGALYGLYLSFTSAKWATILFNLFLYLIKGFGLTAGTHRLWSHRSYKTNRLVEILLMLGHTLTCQTTVVNWSRDHRLHHKYCDTDADPYNSTRGFFFCHMGWLMVKKHPEVIKKGKEMDMSDLLNNPVLKFQNKYYTILSISLVFIMPALIPVYFWEETLNNAHHVSLLGLVLGTHVAFSINSVAHLFGSKPYDQNISPSQNVPLSVIGFGEGYHNYHHVFPFDYRVAELGNNNLNLSTNLIDFLSYMGWAYDLKYASDDMILKRAERTGDGTDLWGRETKDLDNRTTEATKMVNKSE